MEVADGETVALLGPNGAGKSTILDTIAGLVRPDRGRVLLDGRPLTVREPTRRSVWVPPHRRARSGCWPRMPCCSRTSRCERTSPSGRAAAAPPAVRLARSPTGGSPR
ncbi:MAG: ATP-binding cassette domain-containing protein [Nocardioides sp.]